MALKIKSYVKHYHFMLLPGILLLIVFKLIPMFGVLIAFEDFKIGLGIWHSPWVGLENFVYMFQLPDIRSIFYNTSFIAMMKILMHLLIPLVFALLLNEIRISALKRSIQTVVYFPHFLSWVILAGVLFDLLSIKGMINHLLGAFGGKPIMFMASNAWFPSIVIASDTWKEFGFDAIVYLAALAGINPALYEAAVIDGAGRWKTMLHITLPALATTAVLLATLGIGNILNAGFDQIFNLYNPLVYPSGDIIDTYVYRAGLLNAQYSFAAAVGLLKSVISFALIIFSQRMAYRYANYRIF